MISNQFTRSAIALALVAGSFGVQAQMAQVPLLNTATGVPPNIVFVFDDSGSMDSTALYQYGGNAGGLGMTGPGNDAGYGLPSKFHDRSPDVNQIYYDPRVRYAIRVGSNGSPLPAGSTSGITSFNVYFYNPGQSPIYTVNKVNILNPGTGYPSSGVLGKFSLAPSTGRTARATVTTGPISVANTVTVDSMGTNYPNTGVVATFSPPPSGGVTATGTVVVTQVKKISNTTISATSFGSGYSTGTTANFSAPGTPGGMTAQGTPVVVSRGTVQSVTITNPGNGFPLTGKTITFGAPPAGGVTATGTISTGTLYSVGTLSLANTGSNYTSAPAVTFSGTLTAGGVPAVGTASIGTLYKVASVAVSAAGGNGTSYTSAPTVTFSGTLAPGGTPASATTTLGTFFKATTGTTSLGSGTGFSCTNGTRALTFPAPTAPGGVTAAGTGTYSGNKLTSITITTAGSGYTSSPMYTGSGCTTNPSGTAPSTSYQGVASITLTSSGSGYTAAPTIALTGGGGSGAAVTRTTSTFSGVTAVALNNAGRGYTSPPTVALVGGGGSGASLNLTTSNTVGITDVTITNPGSGYTAVPSITLGGTAGGTGQGLTIVSGTSDVITGITVTNPGSGYTAAPTITLSNTGGGTGAAFATPTLANTFGITAINITNKGSGYTSPPTITLSGTASGSGASFTVNTGTATGITGVTVTDAGAGYKVLPTFSITSPSGSGATFSVVTDSTLDSGVNTNWAGNGTPTTAADYFTQNNPYNPADPMKGYIPDAGSGLATGADPQIYYPNTASGTILRYPKFKDRTDCVAVDSCSWSEELQNYANWKTYHSTRLDMAKTGVGLAFQPLGASFRLGYGTINNISSSSNLASGVKLYDTPTNSAFLTWLYATPTNGNTPNRAAINKVGQYYKRADDGGPWADVPPSGPSPQSTNYSGAANKNHASCRRNYTILMTDGYYNESYSDPTDADSTLQVNTAGVTYTPIGPYSDTASGAAFTSSFADIGFKYWFQSLRPDLSQKGLKAVANDEATWPHMNFYAIGLGISGTMDAFTTLPDPNGNGRINPVLDSLTGASGTRLLDWPAPTSNNPKAIDDMWHATVNGRGQFLNAGTAEKLRASIRTIVSAISGIDSSQAGVAVSAVELTSTTRKYTPIFVPGEWSGDVKAFNLTAGTGDQLGIAWEVETPTGKDPLTGANTYKSLIPSYQTRNIFAGNGATSGTRAVAFDFASLTAGMKSDMAGGLPVNADLVNFIRGDSSNEATDENALKSTAIYRVRLTRLGDIVNSTPTFVKNSVDLKYDQLSTPGYRAFVDSKNTNRQEGVLFVGANDGMLHAFRDGNPVAGGNSISASPGGIEVFAYIPNALLPTINKLADKGYSHQYYVDGPLAETDVYLPTAGSWANMVLGTTGGGAGKPSAAGVSPVSAVFAINTTALNSDVTGLNASSVQWEVSSKVSGFSELGYVLTDIQAGPTPDGSWVAIFGNGYESASCKAQLFIVNIETGALIKRIDTGAGSCGANKNGLGGVRLVRNDKGVVLGAYAGDLLGNLWKFDLSSTDNTQWKVGLGGDPLFKTAANQPITAAPTVVDLSTTPGSTTPKPGYMVVVGTGKFYEDADKTSTNQQTLFGVWDDRAFGAADTSTGAPRVSATTLVSQNVKVSTTVNVAGTDITRVSTTKNTVDYSSGKKGWYFDFPNSGQRLVYPMDLLSNRFVAVDSISPSGISTDPCVGGVGGEGFFYIFDALSGAAPSSDVFALLNIGTDTANPDFVNGFSTKADGRNVVVKVDNGTGGTEKGGKDNLCILSTDPTGNCLEIKCEDTGTCINTSTKTLKTRQWRQLFPR